MKKKCTENDQLNQAIKITELETSNQALQEKLKLLRIQLQSQTQFEYAARNLRSRSASLNRSRNNLPSARNFRSPTAMKPVSAKSYDSIYQELNTLQEEFENVKKQHRDHISKLENRLTKKENLSPGQLKNELDENIELINLKRFSKKQAAQIQSLQSDLEVAKTEIKQLQIDLSSITTLKDNLQSELSKEKSEIVKLNSDLSISRENNKLLEEQLKDLQIEKTTLKEHNENLLNLSLRKESIAESSDFRNSFLKQVRELEDDLKRERIMRTDLASKVAEAELQNVKLTSTIADLRSTNTTLKGELENFKEKSKTIGATNSERNSIRSHDKAVMVSFGDNLNTVSNHGIEPDIKLRMYQTERELTQCKELLRVQYSLNNKHKHEVKKTKKESSREIRLRRQKWRLAKRRYMDKKKAARFLGQATSTRLGSIKEETQKRVECNQIKPCRVAKRSENQIEELQVMFQKNETSTSEHLRNFQHMLRSHQERLSRTANQLRNNTLHSTLAELKNSLSSKTLGSFQDYLNIIAKLLEGYILCFENEDPLMSLEDNKKDVFVDASVDRSEKSVQAEIFVKPELIWNDDVANEVSETDSSLLVEPVRSYSVVFELSIEKANFTSFSDHLMKSSQNNPKIFLTWNFLNDNEHQAYTPTISVAEGVFNCTCQYEGPWSQFLWQYLKENGIRVEIHLVQEDISVRLAETLISTSSALEKPNTCETFRSTFKNDNIEGDVIGSFILKCDPSLLSLFS